MSDTAKASWITDHPFKPRTTLVTVPRGSNGEPGLLGRFMTALPPNPALCQHCRTAEAAHAATSSNSLSVKSDQEKHDASTQVPRPTSPSR